MSRKKRIAAFLIAAAMVGTVFTGCGSSTSSSGSTAASTAAKSTESGTPTEITMAFITFGATPDTNSAAFQAINKIAEKGNQC